MVDHCGGGRKESKGGGLDAETAACVSGHLTVWETRAANTERSVFQIDSIYHVIVVLLYTPTIRVM